MIRWCTGACRACSRDLAWLARGYALARLESQGIAPDGQHADLRAYTDGGYERGTCLDCGEACHRDLGYCDSCLTKVEDRRTERGSE